METIEKGELTPEQRVETSLDNMRAFAGQEAILGRMDSLRISAIGAEISSAFGKGEFTREQFQGYAHRFLVEGRQIMTNQNAEDEEPVHKGLAEANVMASLTAMEATLALLEADEK